jgi:hypothetical protein
VPTPRSSLLLSRRKHTVAPRAISSSFSLILEQINCRSSSACGLFKIAPLQSQHSEALTHSLKNTGGVPTKGEAPAKPCGQKSRRGSFRSKLCSKATRVLQNDSSMTRTLVIQLGRLGDLIQTTPLLSELAATGDQVDVLVLRSSHTALLGFSAVANIITIPDSLKPLDDAIACGFPRGKIPVEAYELLADLQLPLYDNIINASHAPLGCWLAGAIPCLNLNARLWRCHP